MLTAVWAAVVAAAAAWVIGAGVAVYVMLKAARLMSQTATAVASLAERGDLLIERANAALDQAGEQIARAETVTAGMATVTATMTEMGGQLTALAPAQPAPGAAIGPLTWAAALVYGVRRALGLRRAAWPALRRPPAGQRPGRTARWHASATRPPARADRLAGRAGRAGEAGPELPQGAGRRAALAGRADGTRR